MYRIRLPPFRSEVDYFALSWLPDTNWKVKLQLFTILITRYLTPVKDFPAAPSSPMTGRNTPQPSSGAAGTTRLIWNITVALDCSETSSWFETRRFTFIAVPDRFGRGRTSLPLHRRSRTVVESAVAAAALSWQLTGGWRGQVCTVALGSSAARHDPSHSRIDSETAAEPYSASQPAWLPKHYFCRALHGFDDFTCFYTSTSVD